ncbi:hypothetical protein EDB85DRAFT_2293157 [Lactarius pseudohatsudake]|nr:hypothetical protein EDB85DRAFT_2293157 [Lactarius pseudohatsudake]
MSQTPPMAPSSSNSQAIFFQQLGQSTTSGHDKLTKWLVPTVNVLYAFSAALGEGAGLVFSPTKVIFRWSWGPRLLRKRTLLRAIVDIFERIESFFRRLEEYSEATRDVMVKIMVEVLGNFGIVTKEMKQGRASRLDRLTQQEVQMAIVEVLKIAHHVKDGAEAVGDKVNVAIEGALNTLATHKSIVNAYTTRWQGSQSDDSGNFVDALQALSRPIAIRKPSPSSLALSVDARLFQGKFGAADLGVTLTRLYLHRSDVVHVKLSDFGLSLNLRAMEREIKDITGTPIELLTSGKAKFADFSKDLRPQDRIPFLRRVNADLQKNGSARHLMANLELDSPIHVYAGQPFDGDMAMLLNSPGHHSFTGSASPVLSEVPQNKADLFEIPSSRRPLANPSTVAAQVAQRSLATFARHSSYMRISRSAATVPPSSSHAYRTTVLRARAHLEAASTVIVTSENGTLACLSLPTHTNSSASLAAATSPPHSHPQAKVICVIPEGNVIRWKLSIILTRQRELRQANNAHLRELPQSMSSVGSSCANSPQSQSLQWNSLRSLQGVVAGSLLGNSSSASSASQAARRSVCRDNGFVVHRCCG